MKKHIAIILFTFLLLPFTISAVKTVSLNSNWKFTKGDPKKAHKVNYKDTAWRIVQIPHDWAIEGPFDEMLPANTGKLPWKGVGWYRNEFFIKSGNPTEKIYLMFDGIMAFPKIYVNGQLAGEWDYGYNSFYLDITDLVNKEGANVIAIRVDTREFDSRWYPGAGIYRKVQLLIANPLHHTVWGTFVQTPVITSDSAMIHIGNQFENTLPNSLKAEVMYQVIDPNGKEVAKLIRPLELPASGKLSTENWMTIQSPKIWDVDHPHLYTLKSSLMVYGETMDVVISKFGIRTFEFTADDGFILNGRRLQLKGVNLHHDHGPLGAKFYPRAMQRQLEIMKGMGANAIRNSHNVAAPEVLRMCDSLGLIFFNEIFDKWDAKAGFLPEMNFDEFAERNIRNWVMRDRNHPCVVLWSVGNEMGDIQFDIDGGFDKLRYMVVLVEDYDTTRPITMVCDAKESAKLRHFDHYDVHSWNYGRRYLPAREIEPGKSVVISESASTLSTRGFYELPLPKKKTDFTQSLQVSSYDLNAPYWAEVADDDFMWQEEDTYVAGEFVWTGFDYLGEPTPYNDEAVKDGFIKQQQSAKSSYFGIVDLCGIPKDRYYLYKSYWNTEDTTVHILPHWNWEGKEGKNIPVFVYTNGDCAELFLNGKSLGKQCKKPDSDNSIERYRLMWHNVSFAPGELKAVAYKEGEVIGDTKMQTAGEPFQLKLTPDRAAIKASGGDLSYILVEAFDEEGNPCPLADNLVHIKLHGPGVIEGFGNGNPQSLEPFMASERKLFYGKAMLIIRSTKKTGKIIVETKSDGLKIARTELVSSKPY